MGNKDRILLAALCDINISTEVKRQIKEMPTEAFNKDIGVIVKYLSNGGDPTGIDDKSFNSILQTLESDQYKIFAGSEDSNKIRTIENVLQDYNKVKVSRLLEELNLSVIQDEFNSHELVSRFTDSVLSLPNVDKPITIADAGKQTLEKAMKAYNGDRVPAISSGYRSLDKIIDGGFGESDIIVITAKSGNGKTTFIQNVVLNILRQYQDKKVLYLTTEMMPDHLQSRFLLMTAFDHKIKGLTYEKFRKPDAKTIELITYLNPLLDKFNIHFQWCRSDKDLARYLYRDSYDVVVVDHINDYNGMGGKDANSIADDIMTTIKTWAVSSSSRTAFVLAQPRKSGANTGPKSDERSSKSVTDADDVKGSQSIQSNASLVLSVYRDLENYCSEISTLKNRHSESGKVARLKFDVISNRLHE